MSRNLPGISLEEWEQAQKKPLGGFAVYDPNKAYTPQELLDIVKSQAVRIRELEAQLKTSYGPKEL